MAFSKKVFTKKALGLLAGISVLASLAGCITFPHNGVREVMPLGQSTFSEYVAQTTDWINTHRRFVTNDRLTELSHQVPFEIRPAVPNGKGILMIHGFTDSPYNFSDIAQHLANKGYLVRAVILPGHGTKPEDMMHITFKDWDQMIDEQTRIMAREVSELYLAGFSTGANMAVHEAYENTQVDGLILFSPALSVRTNLVHFVPLISLFIDWVRTPAEAGGGITPFRYRTAPMQGYSTFISSMNSAMNRMKDQVYRKPVLVFMTEHDSIVNTQELLPLMQRQFASPRSRFVWYGDVLPEGTTASDYRLTVLSDYLPQYRIRSFSHLGIVYSPDNPYYGMNGTERFCLRGQDEEKRNQCHAGTNLWYGSWNENRDNHPYARLTFNPYFDRQIDLIVNTLGSN